VSTSLAFVIEPLAESPSVINTVDSFCKAKKTSLPFAAVHRLNAPCNREVFYYEDLLFLLFH
jgi:hypothetical protein